MGRSPERQFAPHCDHPFTVVNVRGGYRLAVETVEDLRTTHDGQYYISDPYDLAGAWVFALCGDCASPPPRRTRPTPVLDRRRAEKTILKTRHGGLPAATRDFPATGPGDGTACDGCTETIERGDRMSTVHVRGVLTLRFHDACYVAWVRFTA